MPNGFHPDDHAALIGPAQAFDPDHQANPSQYALQNHLALEIVAHLQRAGVPFQFQGGTSLHVKLGVRLRFSIDVDLRTSNAGALHDALRCFVAAFPKSDITLEEPPKDLRVQGVRHTLAFGRLRNEHTGRPLRVDVEVVEADDPATGAEPLALAADGLAWNVDVLAPTLESFAAQKFAVLGPNTIGKPVGPNEQYARLNQGVCKQIFDLRELLRRDLDGAAVAQSYEREVEAANRLQATDFVLDAVVEDALGLLEALRLPRSTSTEVHSALWSGFDDSRRWIAPAARRQWTHEEYRVTAGVLSRLGVQLREEEVPWTLLGQPVRNATVPAGVVMRLGEAQQRGEAWFDAGSFQGSARLAWAWAPRPYW